MSGFIKNKNINNKDIENNLLEENDARLALSSLGYNEKDINNAISEVKKIIGEKYENMKAGEIIRETLKNLR